MSKKTVSQQDAELFQRMVGKVKPVKHDRVLHTRKKPPAVPRQLQRDEQAVLQDMLSDHYDPDSLVNAEMLSFQRPGIQHSLLRKLKRGHYSIGAELDLHGLTSVQARNALTGFLAEAQHSGARCVRIIHGKGRRSSQQGPVLKPKVAHWLIQRDDVLAYCSARPVDGGSGALYVLLKKS